MEQVTKTFHLRKELVKKLQSILDMEVFDENFKFKGRTLFSGRFQIDDATSLMVTVESGTSNAWVDSVWHVGDEVYTDEPSFDLTGEYSLILGEKTYSVFIEEN